jgi:hypothetical protein
VHNRYTRAAAAGALTVALTASAAALAATGSFLGPLHTFSHVASAVPAGGPAKGDVNPYGLVVVPRSAGRLVRGDVLISNFNDKQNLQGTGSSVVEISPSGHQSVFAVVPRLAGMPAVGLTTALAALPNHHRAGHQWSLGYDGRELGHEVHAVRHQRPQRHRRRRGPRRA